MVFRLEFYKSRAGAELALDYIRAQPKRHRAKIGRALQYLEDLGHMARRPRVDYLGGDIYELRVAVEQHQHRLLYFFHERTAIVLTHGIMKQAAEVPSKEIELAMRRKRRFTADPELHTYKENP